MSSCPHEAGWLRITLLITASSISGCVTVHAPLQPDEAYPRDWGELSMLGPECQSLEGTYLNEGVITTADGSTQSVSLTSLLNIRRDARIVSLQVKTRRLDRNGDAFITLRVVPDSNAAEPHELQGCFCIKQTLACTQVSESYWSLPNFGIGGSQRNLYLSRLRDQSLVAKLQNYHADVILGIPVFGMKEPWARFKPAD